MQRRRFLASVLGWGCIGGVGCFATGCGTLLHGERSGRPHSNQIDWKVAALDGLGLIFFFVPGVVAFVVDFSTGAIYLPLESAYPEYGVPLQPPEGVVPQPVSLVYSNVPRRDAAVYSAVREQSRSWQQIGLTRVVVSLEQLKPQRIQQIAARHVGKSVSLDDSQTRLSALAGIDRYGEQASRHQSDRGFGVAFGDALGLTSRQRGEAGYGEKAA